MIIIMSNLNNNTKFCVYDTETTGLDVFVESILEIAFVDLETGDKIYHEYIYPSNGKKITNSNIHHIDESVLDKKNALKLNHALQKLNERGVFTLKAILWILKAPIST